MPVPADGIRIQQLMIKRRQQLEDRVSTIENELSSFRAECEARQKLEERVKALEELVRSNENLMRETDNIISEAEARLPAQEPAEEQKQEEAQKKEFDKICSHIFEKIENLEKINEYDYAIGGQALSKIKTFLDMSYSFLLGIERFNDCVGAHDCEIIEPKK